MKNSGENLSWSCRSRTKSGIERKLKMEAGNVWLIEKLLGDKKEKGRTACLPMKAISTMLKLMLPAQPPPKITAMQASAASSV